MKTYVSIAAAAFAAIAFTAPASAQDPSVVVEIGDLDPERDAEEIDRRIEQAARRVCGPPSSRALTAVLSMQTCRTAAFERARRR